VKTPVIAERGWFGRRFAGMGDMDVNDPMRRPGLAEEIVSALEARTWWSRYGL
jgi:hypothetical protein